MTNLPKSASPSEPPNKRAEAAENDLMRLAKLLPRDGKSHVLPIADRVANYIAELKATIAKNSPAVSPGAEVMRIEPHLPTADKSVEYSGEAAEPRRDERELADEQIDDMLANLDSHAREVDNYDYGLPLSTEDLPKLREIVRESLAARASVAPTMQSFAKEMTEYDFEPSLELDKEQIRRKLASQPQPSAGQTEGK